MVSMSLPLVPLRFYQAGIVLGPYGLQAALKVAPPRPRWIFLNPLDMNQHIFAAGNVAGTLIDSLHSHLSSSVYNEGIRTLTKAHRVLNLRRTSMNPFRVPEYFRSLAGVLSQCPVEPYRQIADQYLWKMERAAAIEFEFGSREHRLYQALWRENERLEKLAAEAGVAETGEDVFVGEVTEPPPPSFEELKKQTEDNYLLSVIGGELISGAFLVTGLITHSWVLGGLGLFSTVLSYRFAKKFKRQLINLRVVEALSSALRESGGGKD